MQILIAQGGQRKGKSLAGLMSIKYCLAANKKLAIGTVNVDALYSQVKLLYPEAKLTKYEGYLLVESE
jgi:hypothetical protein